MTATAETSRLVADGLTSSLTALSVGGGQVQLDHQLIMAGNGAHGKGIVGTFEIISAMSGTKI